MEKRKLGKRVLNQQVHRVSHINSSELCLILTIFMHWRGKWQPTPQCSCLENPRDRGACWAAVYGVAQSWTGLTRLSSSSSRGDDYGQLELNPIEDPQEDMP